MREYKSDIAARAPENQFDHIRRSPPPLGFPLAKQVAAMLRRLCNIRTAAAIYV